MCSGSSGRNTWLSWSWSRNPNAPPGWKYPVRPHTRPDIAWYLSHTLVSTSKPGSGVRTSSGARNDSQWRAVALHASSTAARVA